MSDEEPPTVLLDETPTRVDADEATAKTLTALPGSEPSPEFRTGTGLEVPARLGHFELRDVLGEGGMGAVFKAYDTSLHREVAVKVLSKDVADNTNLIARFQREARSQARLTHPNITTIYFVGEQDGFPYFAIELAPGGTLGDVLRDPGKLDWPDAIDAMLQVVDGLRHAYQRGIIHRDIKPANLLLDADGRVKIADFGLAKPIEEGDAELTAAGSFMGTPQYVAPEQARGEKVDHRADIYSLGATFYHLLAGVPPFDAPTPVGVVMKHGSEPVPDIREANPDVPPKLRAILERMMAKDPAVRFESYDELATALEAARPRSRQPAGFLVRGIAMLVDFVPWVVLASATVDFVLWLFPVYLIVAHTVFGQTIGKWLFRLKVTDEHGDRLPPIRAVLRGLVFIWIIGAIVGVAGLNLLLFGNPNLSVASKSGQTTVEVGGMTYESGAEDGEGTSTDQLPLSAVIMIALTATLVALWIVGLLMAMFDPEKRALHDRLAGTRVIYR